MVLPLALAIMGFLVFEPSAAVPDRAVAYIAGPVASRGLPYPLASAVVEFALNVVLFMPLFFMASLFLARPLGVWVLVGLALSLTIECLQAAFFTERVPEFRDVFANTLGATLGAHLSWLWTRSR